MKIQVLTANDLRAALGRAVSKAAIHCLRYSSDPPTAKKRVQATHRFFLATVHAEMDYLTFSEMVASSVGETNRRFGTRGYLPLSPSAN
jgi:hypothetical protein